jgi:hypothetical protein
MNSLPALWTTARYIALTIVVAGVGIGITAVPPASARDIKLGGQETNHAVAKAPANMVELPPIIVSKRKEDGGWEHLKINAWLAPKDWNSVETMETLKTTISQKAIEAFPQRNFDLFKAPREGSILAKKTIREATETSLGHPWAGDVLIRTMLVY